MQWNLLNTRWAFSIQVGVASNLFTNFKQKKKLKEISSKFKSYATKISNNNFKHFMVQLTRPSNIINTKMRPDQNKKKKR